MIYSRVIMIYSRVIMIIIIIKGYNDYIIRVIMINQGL